ncbi:MAG: hypothetical protein O2817_10335 [Proteobacteria bacterium]|nr:hypothetical protein [Pseudomonadota bacterium]
MFNETQRIEIQPGIYRLYDFKDIPIRPENVDSVEKVVEEISAHSEKADVGQSPLDDGWKDAVRHKLHEGLLESSRGNPKGALPRVADTQAWDGRSQLSGRLLAVGEVVLAYWDDPAKPAPYRSKSFICGADEASRAYTFVPLDNVHDAMDTLSWASQKNWISPRDAVEPIVSFLKWRAAR